MAKITNLCRACLTTKESFTFVLCDNVSADNYFFCTSIEIHENEDLPKTLCNRCYELLERYADFKRTCIQSQHTLFELQNTLRAENNQDVAEDKDTKDYYVNVKIENETNEFPDCIDATDFLGENNESTNKPKRKLKKRKRNGKEKLTGRIKKKLIVREHFKFTCEVCNKKFKYEERFEAHKLFHQGKTPIINCTKCSKTFMTWSGLQRHTDSEHTQVKLDSLKCGKCGKIFKNRQTLKIHEKLHEDGDKSLYVCDVCGKNFSTPFTLKGHLQIHNEDRERSHPCEHCGKKFFTHGMLLTHAARLHAGRRYICQICSYPFTDKYNLSKHLLIHQGVKNFKCDICQKTFGTHSTLVIHKRIHSGERPFACSYCPKAFISKNRLVDHHRIHTGFSRKRKFIPESQIETQCDDDDFEQNSQTFDDWDLNRECQEIVNDKENICERPFRCSVCSQAFTQHGSLRRHMKIHTKAPMIM